MSRKRLIRYVLIFIAAVLTSFLLPILIKAGTTLLISRIEEISEDNVRGKQQMFDLYGRQIQAPAAGQIFILNGKKAVQF